MTNDNNKSEPVFNLPPVVQALCLINIGVFLLQILFPRLLTDDVLDTLAFIPARYTEGAPLGIAALISPVTHMFLHAGWLHISINVGTLMAFGAGLEKDMGGAANAVVFISRPACAARRCIFSSILIPRIP